MILEKWIYNGREVYSRWIPYNDYRKFKPITQVYGVCFTKNNKVLIVKDLGNWKLPGGTPEKGETPEETLKREVFEEATVIIKNCQMIGTQEVIFPNNPDKKQGDHFYQLRYFVMIGKIEKQTSDPATKRTMKRKFIKPSEFKKYIKWGKKGEEMFKEACKKFKAEKINNNLNKDFIKAIKVIYKELEKNKIKWALIGSTNLALQGMDVKPNDLDIVVKLKDLNKIQEIFSSYQPSKITKLKYMTEEPAWEVKIEICGVEIQIMGEKNTGEYVSKLLAEKLTKIKIDNIKIPCFTLKAEADAYSETNRREKAKMIRNFLIFNPTSINN